MVGLVLRWLVDGQVEEKSWYDISLSDTIFHHEFYGGVSDTAWEVPVDDLDKFHQVFRDSTMSQNIPKALTVHAVKGFLKSKKLM